ncbi:MAG TPA: hypothetical protein VMS09_05175 [Paenibacillus sp.]|uniref:hypothetical protein n=1 Tax=Paenibacillus sp. TaxID=58172 RepID=UPI0028D1936D|nr:hypothetical protein [Paenibacillus sp.]HUC91410.1 hypothetical protein [Paenibacillus sp.]
MKKPCFRISALLLIASLLIPVAASAHYWASGYNLYSMSYASVDNDNGVCYQGAQNWQTAVGTTMTQNSGSGNKCYYRSGYLETWYGLYSKPNTYFTIKINKDKLSADYPGYLWNASVSTSTHEFGHAQYLADLDETGTPAYKTTSIMSYARDRKTMTTPQSHDISDIQSMRN